MKNIVTDKGIVTLNRKMVGASLNVLNKFGKWSRARVCSQTDSTLLDVTLCCGDFEKVVTVPEHHMWLLNDAQGYGIRTNCLKEGDTIYLLKDTSEPPIDITSREAEMFTAGFILGCACSGKAIKDNRGLTFTVSGNNLDYLSVFRRCGLVESEHSSEEGNENVKFTDGTGKFDLWTNEIFIYCNYWSCLSSKDLRSVFYGFSAAFQNNKVTKSPMYNEIETTTLIYGTYEMIKKISAIAGYHVISENQTDSNMTLNYITNQRGKDDCWNVKSVEKNRSYGYETEFIYIEEPCTHSLTLEGGIVIGDGC